MNRNISFLLLALFVCLASSIVFGQNKKIQVLVDTANYSKDGAQDIVIKRKTNEVTSILISSESLSASNWKTVSFGTENEVIHTISESKLVYRIVAFGTDGGYLDEVELSFPKSASVGASRRNTEESSKEEKKGATVEFKDCDPIIATLGKLALSGEPGSRSFALRELGKYGENAACTLKGLSSLMGDGISGDLKKELETALANIVRRSQRKESGLPVVAGVVKDQDGTPIDGIAVSLYDKDKNPVAATYTNSEGEYRFDEAPSSSETVSAESKGFRSGPPLPLGKLSGSHPRERNLVLGRTDTSLDGQYSRVILGFEQSGATSADGKRNFFFDGFFSIPLPYRSGYLRGANGFPFMSVWANPRIASAPDPAIDELAISQFVQEFGERAAQTKVGNLVQTFEFNTGLELTLTHPRRRLWGFESGITNRVSVGLIAGGGITAPINPRDRSAINIFNVSPEAVARYPEAEGKDYIAFVSPERDRFYRQYFGGVRIKTFYHTNGGRSARRYPAIFDLTFGQNEAITGGHLRGGVFKVEGFVPFPIKDFGSLFIFGTAQMNFSRANFSDPLILQRAASNVTLPNNNAAIVTVLPQSRDYYRIGFGVDPVRLFKDFYRIGKGKNETLLTGN